MALQPRGAKTDWSGYCQMAVQGALWLAKRLSLNLNFSFFNQISLLLISSSYPIILTRLGGPRSRPYTFYGRGLYPGIEPGTFWTAVRPANHYTKQAVTALKSKVWWPMISGDWWRLCFLVICLTVEEKPWEKPNEENDPSRDQTRTH